MKTYKQSCIIIDGQLSGLYETHLYKYIESEIYLSHQYCHIFFDEDGKQTRAAWNLVGYAEKRNYMTGSVKKSHVYMLDERSVRYMKRKVIIRNIIL